MLPQLFWDIAQNFYFECCVALATSVGITWGGFSGWMSSHDEASSRLTGQVVVLGLIGIFVTVIVAIVHLKG